MDTLIALNTAAEIAVKTSAVLVVSALLVLLAGRKSSAALRQGIWASGLYAVLLMPMFILVLPGWGVLPRFSVAEIPGARGGELEVGVVADEVLETPASQALYESVDPGGVSISRSGEDLGFKEGVTRGFSGSTWVAILWSTGLAFLLGRMVASRIGLARLGARSPAVCGGRVCEVFDEVFERSGIRGRVRLLISADRVMPMSWGVVSRTILLPEDAGTWDRGRLRSVLFHEMAHLERWDPLQRIVVQVACAIHWFNPLVWIAAWRQQIECEVACDDRVLGAGVRGSEYATHLLEVVTGSKFSPGSAGGAVAMARSKSQSERRVAAAVDPGRKRGRNTGMAMAVVCVCALCIVVPFSMLTAAPEAPADSAEDDSGAEEGGGGAEVPASREEVASMERHWESLVANQKRYLQLVQSGYEEGTASMSEVLEAETDVQNARIGLARVKGDREAELAALRRKVEIFEERLSVAKSMFKEGQVTERSVLVQEAEVLKVRIELEEAKSKSGVGKDLDERPVPAPEGGGKQRPEDVYLEGYLTLHKGETLIEQGKVKEGRAKIKEAEERFEYIERNWPAWQRDMVRYRLRLIRREISTEADDRDSDTLIVDNFGVLPPPFELYVRDGDEVVKALAADRSVAKGYWEFRDKGKLRGGRRITIMTAKRRYKPGEEIRVIHVLEATVSGIDISHVGPKRIFDEYVDGELVTPPRDAVTEVIRGSIKPSPAVDFLYEITSYSFDELGEHTIQWKGGGHAHEGGLGLESNTLRVVVEK